MSRQFSKETKRLAWKRSQGRCEYICDGFRCDAFLTAGNRIYDHEIPWAISQDSSIYNCQVICARCDRDKTAADKSTIAKTGRQFDFDKGITGPGLGRSPMPAGRLSRFKKTFRHGVMPRTTQAQQYRALMRDLYPGWQP